MAKKLAENLRNSLPNITARPPAQDTADEEDPGTQASPSSFLEPVEKTSDGSTGNDNLIKLNSSID
jgi:hypothetical protein